MCVFLIPFFKLYPSTHTLFTLLDSLPASIFLTICIYINFYYILHHNTLTKISRAAFRSNGRNLIILLLLWTSILITKRFRIIICTSLICNAPGDNLIAPNPSLHLRGELRLGRLEVAIGLVGLKVGQVLVVAHDFHRVYMRARNRLSHFNRWDRPTNWHLERVIFWLDWHFLRVKGLVVVVGWGPEDDIWGDALGYGRCNLIGQFDHRLAAVDLICRDERCRLEAV